MLNRAPFRNYQSMNVVHRTKEGSELWLGDYYAASDLSLLRQKNIRSAMLGVSYQKEHGINHKTISALDIPSYRMTPHFEEAFRFIADALARGHLLVHCAAGISRSTTFVLVYLMRSEGMSFRQAMDYVRSKRAVICPNYGFQNELKRYELALKKSKQQKKEQSFANYSGFSEKKIVMDFVNEDKKTPKREEKFSYTVSGTRNDKSYMGNLSGTFKDASGFLRGQSVNYASKQRRPADLTPDFKAAQKYARQYLSHKLQAPKIATFKK